MLHRTSVKWSLAHSLFVLLYKPKKCARNCSEAEHVYFPGKAIIGWFFHCSALQALTQSIHP